jgi:prepilin-type N-terminal cleavage/methylation domain-containing protein
MSRKLIYPKNSKGFTLIELLIVIALLIILMAASFTNWKMQIQKGHDAKRKTDLYHLKAALENYQNDHGCYPTEDLMNDCKSEIFTPYNLPIFPCDPDGKSYYYELIVPSNSCGGYRLYARLFDKTNPDIAKIGCDRPNGCGVAGHPEYNYGVSMGAPVAQ